MNILKRLAGSYGRWGSKLRNERRAGLLVEALEDRVLLSTQGGLLEVFWGAEPFSPTAGPGAPLPQDGVADFNLIYGGMPADQSYDAYITMHNYGSGDLGITDVSMFGLDLQPDPWTVDVNYVTPDTIIPGEYRSFGVNFDPTVIPSQMLEYETFYTGNLTIESISYVGASPDYFSAVCTADLGDGGQAPEPEIEVWYGQTELQSGVGETDFGSFVPAGRMSFDVLIHNSGTESLRVDEPLFYEHGGLLPDNFPVFSVDTGAAPWQAGDFGYYMTVAPGDWGTITVDVNTGYPDSYDYMQMVLPNSDATGGENPFVVDFVSEVVGTRVPEEISVWYGPGYGEEIADGETNPVYVGPLATYPNGMFEIDVWNVGADMLYVQNPITFQNSAGGSADDIFTVDTTSAGWYTSVPDGAQTLAIVPGTFETIPVWVNNSDFDVSGTYYMSLPNSDGDENPFDFAYTFDIVDPEISVSWLSGSHDVEDGLGYYYDGAYQPVYYGYHSIGDPPSEQWISMNYDFTVTNDGPAGSILDVPEMSWPVNIDVTGVPGGFQLGSGESLTFNATLFLPEGPVELLGQSINVYSNDSDESQFSIPLDSGPWADPDPTLVWNVDGDPEVYSQLGYEYDPGYYGPIDMGHDDIQGGGQLSATFTLTDAEYGYSSGLIADNFWLRDPMGYDAGDFGGLGVYEFTGLDGGGTVESLFVSVATGESHTFALNVYTAGPVDLYGYDIVFNTNSGSEVVFEVPLEGEVVQTADIAVQWNEGPNVPEVYDELGWANTAGYEPVDLGEIPVGVDATLDASFTLWDTQYGASDYLWVGQPWLRDPFGNEATDIDKHFWFDDGWGETGGEMETYIGYDGPSSATFGIDIYTMQPVDLSGYAIVFDTNCFSYGTGGVGDESVFEIPLEGMVTTPVVVADPPEIAVAYGGSQLTDGQSGLDFGSFDYEAAGGPISFVVSNTGEEPLTLGTPSLPSGFSMGSNGLVSSLAGGASDTFTIVLDTSVPGVWSGQLVIGNNDSNENPFNFGITATVEMPPAPELDVFVGSTEVSDGQMGAVGFADAVYGGAGSQVVFTLKNTGTAELTFDSFDVPNGFSIVSDLPGVLAAGASADLTIELDTAAAGLKLGQVVIGNNDDDENPFNFPIGGVVLAPEISVDYTGGAIADDQVGAIDYGTAMPGAVSEFIYTVSNDGNAELILGTLDLPGGFYAVGSLPGSLAPGASAQVTIGLNTSVSGSFGGQVVIGNNDSDENPFNFPVAGEVASSEIAVFLGDTLIVDGATEAIDFGEINEGSAGNELTFLVRNLGNAPLSLDGINVPAGFTVTEGLVGSLAAGGSDEFTVRLDGDAAGDFGGEISFSNGDADENPFNFAVAGQVFGAVPHEGNYLFVRDGEVGGPYILVTLSGPGEFDVFTSPGDPLRVESVVVTGSTAQSMLQVVLVGIGQGSIGDIQVDGALGLGMLRSVTLTGVFDIAETVDALFLDDIGAEAQVSAGTWSPVGTTVLTQDVGVGACFDIPGRVNLFRASSFEQGTLTAGCFGSIVVGTGDFGVDVTAEQGNIGSLLVPQGDVTGKILAAYDVGRILNMTGSFSATLRARRLGWLVSRDMDGALVSVSERADVILLQQDVVDSHVLLGYDIGMNGEVDTGAEPVDDILHSGQLRFFSYGGTFANSHLSLGVTPNYSPLFTDAVYIRHFEGLEMTTRPSHGYIMGNQVTADNGGQLFGLYYDAGVGSTLQTTLTPNDDFVIVDGVIDNPTLPNSDPGGVGAISFTLIWDHDGSDRGPDIDLHVIDPLDGHWDYHSEGSAHFDYDDQGEGGSDPEDDGNGPERAYWDGETAPVGDYEIYARWYDYGYAVTDADSACVTLNVYERQVGGEQELVASYTDVLESRTDETPHWIYYKGVYVTGQ
ncbi:MAG: choice-of-anchor D domain-containing protein [Sedimentisphaerales bacterium]|nr:choice-of-anchor D domain-containing protein [Sedimentisphaerales bacterium]